jgi:hypothetical protein
LRAQTIQINKKRIGLAPQALLFQRQRRRIISEQALQAVQGAFTHQRWQQSLYFKLRRSFGATELSLQTTESRQQIISDHQHLQHQGIGLGRLPPMPKASHILDKAPHALQKRLLQYQLFLARLCRHAGWRAGLVRSTAHQPVLSNNQAVSLKGWPKICFNALKKGAGIPIPLTGSG